MIIKNLGPIKDINLELNQQTIFLGENNVGKTYISYLVYGVFRQFHNFENQYRTSVIQEIVDQKYSEENSSVEINTTDFLEKIIDKVVQKINLEILDFLPIIFNLPPSYFENTEITVVKEDFNIIRNRLEYIPKKGTFSSQSPRGISGKVNLDANSKGNRVLQVLESTSNYVFDDMSSNENEKITVDIEELNDISVKKSLISKAIDLLICRRIFSKNQTLYIPAERNGINVFKDELLTKRSNYTFDLFTKEFESSSVENSNSILYPLAISDYMKYINIISSQLKLNTTELQEANSNSQKNKNIGARFTEKVLKGEFKYDLNLDNFYYEQINNKELKIPLKTSSSSTKSLFGLNFYITNLYKAGDILFIDEPEMNLDPQNQIEFAKILLELNKSGVQLIISTHSDYLVRATTNELLKEKIEGKENHNVSTYYFSTQNIIKIGNLTENNFIANFDNANMLLEREYLKLIDILIEGE